MTEARSRGLSSLEHWSDADAAPPRRRRRRPRFCEQIVVSGKERARARCQHRLKHNDTARSSEMPAKIETPGFEPKTSPTRTAHATKLRHAPKFDQFSLALPPRP